MSSTATQRHVVVSSGVVIECSITDGCILTGSVVKERPRTIGCVGGAGSVVKRLSTDGCVVAVVHVHIERPMTNGCVVVATHVQVERPLADGRVEAASARQRVREAEQSAFSFSGIVPWIAAVRWWSDRPRGLRKREAENHERGEKKTRLPEQTVIVSRE